MHLCRLTSHNICTVSRKLNWVIEIKSYNTVSEVWSLDQQCQLHLRICCRGSFSGHTSDPLNWQFWVWDPELCILMSSPDNWDAHCCLRTTILMLVAQSCPTLFDSIDYSPPVSFVHGIVQARILQWVAIPFSKGSSWPRDGTWESCISGRFFIIWATNKGEVLVTMNISTCQNPSWHRDPRSYYQCSWVSTFKEIYLLLWVIPPTNSTDEKNEVQRKKVTCAGSESKIVIQIK